MLHRDFYLILVTMCSRVASSGYDATRSPVSEERAHTMILRSIVITVSKRILTPTLLVIALLLAACEGNPVFVEDGSGGSEMGDVDVLFIGNSITMWFNMTTQFEALADSAGKSIHVSDISRLGQRLENHLEFVNTEAAISSRVWDYVILQESNFAVAFPEYHYLMHPEFSTMREYILSASPDCNIVMYMDYALERDVHGLCPGGDNPPRYPVHV